MPFQHGSGDGDARMGFEDGMPSAIIYPMCTMYIFGQVHTMTCLGLGVLGHIGTGTWVIDSVPK